MFSVRTRISVSRTIFSLPTTVETRRVTRVKKTEILFPDGLFHLGGERIIFFNSGKEAVGGGRGVLGVGGVVFRDPADG